MRGLLAILLAAAALAAPAKSVEDPSERLAVSGESLEVSGAWMMASEDLSADDAVLTVSGGDLVFRPGTIFQTDDYEPFREKGALLWSVTGGRAVGAPRLDPASLTNEWEIAVSDGGRTGRLVARRVERSAFAWLKSFADEFHACFFANGRWQYLTSGLATTLEVALSAVLLGALIGFLVAIVRSTHDKNGRFPVLNALMKTYLTVIRGTPMAVQLLIAYFIIFASCNNKTLVAILAFGLNSGAYVAEIMRAGIESIDAGQSEAGRALGLSSVATMVHIILPQAIRNVLPALGNEFIVLLKDTSIASFIALQDLAKGGEIIRSQTYNVYLPFLMVAAIYLALVMLFTWLLGKVERHLRQTGADVVHGEN